MKRKYLTIIAAILSPLILIALFIPAQRDRIVIRDKTVVEIDPTRPVIALTFDDGPNYSYTIEILEILHINESTATFFINGKNVAGNAGILRKIVLEGNEIANHTYDHADLTQLNKDEIKKQVEGTQEAVNKVLGDYRLLYVRPPCGRYNETVIASIDYPLALWTLDSHDWEAMSSEAVYRLVINSVKNLDVLIMHDTSDITVEAVKMIIPDLKEKGFQFVTLSELYRYRGETPQAHNIYR